MYEPTKDDITYKLEGSGNQGFTVVMSFNLKKFGSYYSEFLKARVPYRLDNILKYFIKITDDYVLLYTAGRDKIEDVPERVVEMGERFFEFLQEIYKWLLNFNDDCVCAIQNDIIKFPKDK